MGLPLRTIKRLERQIKKKIIFSASGTLFTKISCEVLLLGLYGIQQKVSKTSFPKNEEDKIEPKKSCAM